MSDTKLKVILNTTLKKYDGTLFMEGTEFLGILSELPDEIQYAVNKAKQYISVLELPQEVPVPEVKTEDTPEVKTEESLDEKTEDTTEVKTEDTPEVKTEESLDEKTEDDSQHEKITIVKKAKK